MTVRQNLFFFVVDIVGSSDTKLTIHTQTKKISKVLEFIKNSNEYQYKKYESFTGDGVL